MVDDVNTLDYLRLTTTNHDHSPIKFGNLLPDLPLIIILAIAGYKFMHDAHVCFGIATARKLTGDD